MFSSISQRVACTYVRTLAPLKPYLPETLAHAQQAEWSTSQASLHAFFQAFYANLFEHPEAFGLPTHPDTCITGSEPNPKDHKQEVTRRMKAPRERIDQALSFLRWAGETGELRGQALQVSPEAAAALLKANRSLKPFLKGLEQAGLFFTCTEEKAALSNTRFPEMMPAMQLLARACAQILPANLGTFCFARCDFGVLEPGYHPTALDLYQIFPAAEQCLAARLHEFFSGLGYKPIFAIYPNLGWEVQYQGRRQVKSTPFLRIQYSDRHQNPLYVDMKLASADRIISLIYQQPRALQEDFFHRSTPCADCTWCENRKNLGPSIYEFDGVQKKICWFTIGDMGRMDDEKVKIIEQYALMHEQLG